MFGGLKAIEDRLGAKNFPLINQYYYSNWSQMGFIPGSYPQVIKVAHVDAGMGKMKIEEHQQMLDARSIVGIHGDYATSEPFYTGAHDLRIQKIGQRIRAFKRTGMSWKTNVDSLEIESVQVEPRHLQWINEAANMNGVHMDICTMDILVTEEGKEYILEINGCGSGVPYLTEDEDCIAMADVCLDRLHHIFIKKQKEDTADTDITQFKLLSDDANTRNKIEGLEMDYQAMVQQNERLRRQIASTNLFVKWLKALRDRYWKPAGVLIVVVVGVVLTYLWRIR